MARKDGPCRKTEGCLYYHGHEGDCFIEGQATGEDWDEIVRLSDQLAKLMFKFYTHKTYDIGPYSHVGQARYRVRSAIEYWKEHVPRP